MNILLLDISLSLAVWYFNLFLWKYHFYLNGQNFEMNQHMDYMFTYKDGKLSFWKRLWSLWLIRKASIEEMGKQM